MFPANVPKTVKREMHNTGTVTSSESAAPREGAGHFGCSFTGGIARQSRPRDPPELKASGSQGDFLSSKAPEHPRSFAKTNTPLKPMGQEAVRENPTTLEDRDEVPVRSFTQSVLAQAPRLV
jgi:hypothetical protein